MALPPLVVGVGFLLVVLASLALMAYIAWRGSRPTEFFLEAVRTTYDLQLSDADIDAYYDLKDALYRRYAPEEDSRPEPELATSGDSCGADAGDSSWVQRVPPQERHDLRMALMKRLVSCIDKLDRVQRDKPGNWKLWRGKLVSERYWGSICDAERMVSEEIDSCTAEADELEPGWREHIFPQAVQYWRRQKQIDIEKKVQKKVGEKEKKAKEKEVKRKEVEERLKEEDKVRQEKAAEKAMEKLLREEEQQSKQKVKATAAGAKAKAKGKSKK